MTKKISRRIGIVMLVAAIIFTAYALGHPEANWAFPLDMAYLLYAVYGMAAIVFLVAPFQKKQ